ncbi:hypothetical protein HELRODRAFT_172567 [Helobdella robusta]|uniref:Uncharacterized protein n=1 Tax=Helobdella robusta TaxID=6412 RepID=T1F5J0_HELRO|nr:hypothetical protein HELRODRAFT_172567 [Helobdella robusta]ESO04217.1 hypothetical protein HELRODRAFT_172567 [Helobdella robusta]
MSAAVVTEIKTASKNLNTNSWADRCSNSTSNLINNNKILYSNNPVSESNDDEGFQPVEKAKKKRKLHVFPQVHQASNSNIISKKPLKMYGTGTNCALKASKIIVKKRTFYVGNVGPCNKETIENHLRSKNIDFIHCYPVLRKRNPEVIGVAQNNLLESTAFKINLPVDESSKLTSPDIWPKYAFLREWDYSATNIPRTAEDKIAKKSFNVTLSNAQKSSDTNFGDINTNPVIEMKSPNVNYGDNKQ